MNIQKIFKVALLVVTIVVAGVFIAGMATPGEWQVSSVKAMNATPAQVAETVSTPKTWPAWTPWTKEKYPEMTREFAGPDAGPGANMSWNDGSMGGTITMTESDSPLAVSYELNMDNGRFLMDCGFDIAPQGSGSQVTWFCRGDSGSNPIQRLMMKLLFTPMMRGDFETGLENLANYEQ
jgi:hypothetical protein